mmetsp:Transcript_31228/g.68572  ORF Transcript_31228/g.68572 Transcript_31228/m.68572 type:complete len:167 (+) Transcript_31228:36-536(+)
MHPRLVATTLMRILFRNAARNYFYDGERVFGADPSPNASSTRSSSDTFSPPPSIPPPLIIRRPDRQKHHNGAPQRQILPQRQHPERLEGKSLTEFALTIVRPVVPPVRRCRMTIVIATTSRTAATCHTVIMVQQHAPGFQASPKRYRTRPCVGIMHRIRMMHLGSP